MRLHRLSVTAFGPFGGTHEVDFDALSAAGLFLLHGPTGAGKTSILDAVCYALYGAVPGARQGSTLSLRSHHADPNTPTSVRLELTVADRRLEITRRPEQLRPKKRGDGMTRDKAQTLLREQVTTGPNGPEWKALSRSHQEVGEEIGQLLGMSREQFCQVVLLPQGDFARFLRADDQARGQLLGRLFDTGRFAAVEDRLAELRRTTQRRVASGDEDLLRLAHRIAQEAGDNPDARERPLPDLTPGEPGLAAAVLEWAAIARSGARERRDVALAAVRAAEATHHAAGRRAEEAAELDRLQRRYAQARARAAELAERAPEREQTRERLRRARDAEVVAPALDLCQTAERDLRAARDAEERCRAPLPPHLATADRDQLAALERELRQELGQLAAARRLERRASDIDTELAALDRDARADEDAIAEAAEWLAGWSERRLAHQRRVDACQEAAARADQLAARIDPAVRARDAAELRDRLTGRVEALRAERLRAAERSTAARDHWLDLKERRLRGIAAELAAALRPGQPCAVCGSSAHPAPAQAGEDHVDRAAEEAAQAAHQETEALREEAESQLGAACAELAAATASAGDTPAAELAHAVSELRREHATAQATGAETHAAREELAHAEREYERRRAQREDAERRVAARTSRRETLAGELASLTAQLTEARRGAASVAARADRLERQVTQLADAVEAAAASESAARRLREARERLADAAQRAGFPSPRDAADAVLDASRREALQQALDQWQAEEAAVAAELADPAARAAAGRPPADLARAEAAVEAATHALRGASARETAARERCDQLDQLSTQAARAARALGPLRAEYERVAALASLTAGTSAENERKMRLESYVLAARLEQVAAAASARLDHMSGGRYTLVHSDARTSGRGRAGLGLHVIDAWTGHGRDTATLSGGETFFASLALALGLADVVTDEAGGVRLDTLFIDEGFGSLDEQTLDEVLDVLDSLRERDRTVGIVSHVADLRQRVPAQLEVVKGRAGSAVRHRLGV
ncbi:SMC family ATPase [Streptomyces sp. AC536]|uniref:AAA family ATPase n=1 Tax=Streptomyces buecherae TaxID=2763006 RepID=UPI00164E55DE|nr:SMC family ATPase [Streptomyces buecherae]MBC3983804.1 SMC family ATPase [Streptomyces buecherae]QNJ38725.1 SMC family ATPase [Streptomyces buecherae]